MICASAFPPVASSATTNNFEGGGGGGGGMECILHLTDFLPGAILRKKSFVLIWSISTILQLAVAYKFDKSL